jgi:transcriptional regulator with XRE-family HTH domain
LKTVAVPRARGAPKGVVKASPDDLHINLRIRLRRLELALPLAHLAAHLGVSTQQMINYESGRHRISAGRLYQIAFALRTPVEWFYEGLPPIAASSSETPEERQRWKRAMRPATTDQTCPETGTS